MCGWHNSPEIENRLVKAFPEAKLVNPLVKVSHQEKSGNE